jgi:serine/threonine protein kinase
MIIMPYYESGDLVNYISNDFYNISWETKLSKLRFIINGLLNIHSVDIIHRDFHSGNIFFRDEYNVYIGDLGISKSATESTDDNNENYGIIPYMAPEIFQGQKYTKSSDIYSFGMIMWEFMTARRPFWDRNHDTDLIIEICDGLRPPIVIGAPEGYIELMKECWYSDPKKRPTATKIHEKIVNMQCKEYYDENPTKIIESPDIGPVKINNPGAIYKSRPLGGMINSVMSLRNSRSQSTIDLKTGKQIYLILFFDKFIFVIGNNHCYYSYSFFKVKRKFEDNLIEDDNDNGMVSNQIL